MVFHGHSKSGKVKGPLVYANYGSRQDFERLKDQGIDTRGSITLMRYYGSQGDRALKVKAAELAGAVGCIIYSDPAEDGFLLGNDTVQRGAVSLMSWIVGDVLSSGFASFPGEERRDSKDGNKGLVNIPSVRTFIHCECLGSKKALSVPQVVLQSNQFSLNRHCSLWIRGRYHCHGETPRRCYKR